MAQKAYRLSNTSANNTPCLDLDALLRHPEVQALRSKPRVMRRFKPLILPRLKHDWPLPSSDTLERCLDLARERREHFLLAKDGAMGDEDHWDEQWQIASNELENLNRVCGLDAGESTVNVSGPQELLDGLTPDGDITPQCDLAKKRLGVRLNEKFPEGMKTELYPHQFWGLWWLRWIETHSPQRGGILADDMGVGKTLQMIALVYWTKGDRQTKYAERGTLIIAPASLLDQWHKEINENTDGLLTSVIWRAPLKNQKGASALLDKYDVVLTSYDEVANSFNLKPRVAPLFRREYQRVVAEEAQYLASPDTLRTRAVLSVKARHHWCLTGTPVSNHLDDAQPLLQLIGVPELRKPEVFHERIGKWQKVDPARATAALFAAFRPCMLRRMGSNLFRGRPIVPIPEKLVEPVYLAFDPEAQAEYNEQASKAKDRLKLTLKTTGEKGLDAGELQSTVLRLRQFCCHPALLPPKSTTGTYSGQDDAERILDEEWEDRARDAVQALLDQSSTIWDCAKCGNRLFDRDDMLIAPCKHAFCIGCFEQERARMGSGAHRGCKRPDYFWQAVSPHLFHTVRNEPGNHVTRAVMGGLWSAKLKYLKRCIEKHLQADRTTRFLVVSQWTMFLDIVQAALKTVKQVRTALYDGRMNPNQRTAVVEAFQRRQKDSPTVLLLSIAAGGAGLNLMSANVAIFLEPNYNVARESQAEGRIHRIGQTKVSYIYYLRMMGTVEEGIIDMQKDKQFLIAGSLGKAGKAVASKNANVALILRHGRKGMDHGQKEQERAGQKRKRID